MVSSAQKRAHLAVRAAVISGELPPLERAPCADCGEPAAAYHHPMGYARQHWLTVEPLCSRHHAARKHHHGATDRTKRLVVELLPDEHALIRDIRVQSVLQGETLRDWVMRAVKTQYEREWRPTGGPA